MADRPSTGWEKYFFPGKRGVEQYSLGVDKSINPDGSVNRTIIFKNGKPIKFFDGTPIKNILGIPAIDSKSQNWKFWVGLSIPIVAGGLILYFLRRKKKRRKVKEIDE